ncbi:MAG: hypothetical protein ACXWCY_26815 [Burkholderiales bacterium]
MKIAVLDDYSGAFSKVTGFARLKDHEVAIYNDTVKDGTKLAARLHDADAVVITQERSALRREVIEKLPKLKLIAQTGSHRSHIDIDACTERGIAIAALNDGEAGATPPSSSRGRSSSRRCGTSPMKRSN